MFKSILLAFFFCMNFAFLAAQELYVIDARNDPQDLSASTNLVTDSKGFPCALLHIAIPSIKNVTFGDAAVQSSYEGGVYNVYVPAKTKQITLNHLNYEPLKIKFKDFGIKIESKCVYSISVAPKEDVYQLMSADSKEKRYVTFHVFPTKSTITINGERLHSQRGQVTKLLPLGKYSFSVSAPDYHDFDSSFVLENKKGLEAFNIKLVPEFGWLSIDCPQITDSSTVCLDGNEIGILPIWRTGKIKSGKHQLKISKDYYQTLYMDIEISDGNISNLNVVLQPNSVYVRIHTEQSVEIWINGALKGKGEWEGRLVAGDYKIEGKRPGYHPVSVVRNFVSTPTPIEIELPYLEPTFIDWLDNDSSIVQNEYMVMSLSDIPVSLYGDSYVLESLHPVSSLIFTNCDKNYEYRFCKLLSPSGTEYLFSVYFPYGEFDTEILNDGLDMEKVTIIDETNDFIMLDLQKWEKGTWHIISYQKYFPTDCLWVLEPTE